MSVRRLLRRTTLVLVIAIVLAIAGAEQLALVCVGIAAAATLLEFLSHGSLDPHVQVMAFIVLMTLGTAATGIYLVLSGQTGVGVLFLMALPLWLLAIRHEIRRWHDNDDAPHAN